MDLVVPCVERKGFLVVGDCIVIVLEFVVCVGAFLVGELHLWIAPDALGVGFDCLLEFLFRTQCDALVQVVVGFAVNLLVLNQTVKVVVDRFGRYAVVGVQLFQYGWFLFGLYLDRYCWVDEPLARFYENAFLSCYSVDWFQWLECCITFPYRR